ncbi:MAG: hypothetical protein ACE148_10015 [Vicinamibacterales bacterium]
MARSRRGPDRPRTGRAEAAHEQERGAGNELWRAPRESPAGGSGGRPPLPGDAGQGASDEQLQAAIEGVRAMGEWSRAIGRHNPNRRDRPDLPVETGGPRGAGQPQSPASGGRTETEQPRDVDAREHVARSTLRKRGLSAGPAANRGRTKPGGR